MARSGQVMSWQVMPVIWVFSSSSFRSVPGFRFENIYNHPLSITSCISQTCEPIAWKAKLRIINVSVSELGSEWGKQWLIEKLRIQSIDLSTDIMNTKIFCRNFFSPSMIILLLAAFARLLFIYHFCNYLLLLLIIIILLPYYYYLYIIATNEMHAKMRRLSPRKRGDSYYCYFCYFFSLLFVI